MTEAPGRLSQRLLGAWRLLTAIHQSETATPVDQLGAGATGFLLYTSDGFMSAQLQAKGRPPFKGHDPLVGTPEEFEGAAPGYLAYAGPYDLDEKNCLLTHQMAVSLFPNWVGARNSVKSAFKTTACY